MKIILCLDCMSKIAKPGEVFDLCLHGKKETKRWKILKKLKIEKQIEEIVMAKSPQIYEGMPGLDIEEKTYIGSEFCLEFKKKDGNFLWDITDYKYGGVGFFNGFEKNLITLINDYYLHWFPGKIKTKFSPILRKLQKIETYVKNYNLRFSLQHNPRMFMEYQTGKELIEEIDNSKFISKKEWEIAHKASRYWCADIYKENEGYLLEINGSTINSVIDTLDKKIRTLYIFYAKNRATWIKMQFNAIFCPKKNIIQVVDGRTVIPFATSTSEIEPDPETLTHTFTVPQDKNEQIEFDVEFKDQSKYYITVDPTTIKGKLREFFAKIFQPKKGILCSIPFTSAKISEKPKEESEENRLKKGKNMTEEEKDFEITGIAIGFGYADSFTQFIGYNEQKVTSTESERQATRDLINILDDHPEKVILSKEDRELAYKRIRAKQNICSLNICVKSKLECDTCKFRRSLFEKDF